MPPKKVPPPTELAIVEVESRVHLIRGVRVMLDYQLAELYEVPTRALNQAVDRNPQRFPEDFSFLLTDYEVQELQSQSTTAHGGRRKRPRAFTEQGIAMLSSVLRSETAVRVNIAIMRAFVRLRRLLATPGELVAQLQQLAETVQVHDKQIKTIIDALQRMLAPPPEAPKRRIGFHDPNSEPPHEEPK